MTIGYLLDDNLDVSDGVQQAMILVAERMRTRGHDVHYIVANTKRTDLVNIHSVGRSFSLNFNGNSVRTPIYSPKSKIKKLLAEVEFDAIHVQMPYSPILAGKVIKYAGDNTKIIGTFHILPYNRLSVLGTKMLGFLNKKTNSKITKAYAVSKPALEFMESSYGLQGEVLPNPVDYKFYKSKKSKRSTGVNIVFVGRFDERKGVMNLARAVKILRESGNFTETNIIMCGKGPLLGQVQKYSDDNKLNIKFPGYVTEQQKAEYLASATMAIFPSISGESFGIVLTEAMSAGAGITLGGNNPGYASVLQQWPDTLFDATDPDKIATKIIQMAYDTVLRDYIGKSQHETVKQYDIEVILDSLENAYSK